MKFSKIGLASLVTATGVLGAVLNPTLASALPARKCTWQYGYTTYTIPGSSTRYTDKYGAVNAWGEYTYPNRCMVGWGYYVDLFMQGYVSDQNQDGWAVGIAQYDPVSPGWAHIATNSGNGTTDTYFNTFTSCYNYYHGSCDGFNAGQIRMYRGDGIGVTYNIMSK